jgi:hypothetical protein
MTDFLDDDPQAAEYHRLRKARGQDAADRYLAGELRAENVTPELLKIAADKVDPDVKAPRGRPVGGHLDPVWHEIGQDFDGLTHNSIKAEDAYPALADEYGIGPRTIAKLIRSYREEMAAAQAQQQAWRDEFNSWPAEERSAFWKELERDTAAIEADPAYAKATNDLQNAIEEELAEARQKRQQCPNGCTKGCKKDHLLTNRHLCPFSASPRNKFRN